MEIEFPENIYKKLCKSSNFIYFIDYWIEHDIMIIKESKYNMILYKHLK